MALLILVLACVHAAHDPAAPEAVVGAGNAVDKDGYEQLPAPIWAAARLRWCSLIDLATAPGDAGSTIRVALDIHKPEGASFYTWRFLDAAGKLALSSHASACLSTVRTGLEEGKYGWTFTIPREDVATSADLDSAGSADPGFVACAAENPEKIASDVIIATVVDTDGRVWTSDGTQDTTGLRHCLGQAHNAWVSARIAAGEWPLAAPSVAFARLAAGPHDTGSGKGVSGKK